MKTPNTAYIVAGSPSCLDGRAHTTGVEGTGNLDGLGPSFIYDDLRRGRHRLSSSPFASVIKTVGAGGPQSWCLCRCSVPVQLGSRFPVAAPRKLRPSLSDWAPSTSQDLGTRILSHSFRALKERGGERIAGTGLRDGGSYQPAKPCR